MIRNAIDRLEYLCDTIPALLTAIDDYSFSEKVKPEKWSRKKLSGTLLIVQPIIISVLCVYNLKINPTSFMTKTNGTAIIFTSKLTGSN